MNISGNCNAAMAVWLGVIVSGSPALAACPLQAARYAIRDEQGVTAGFAAQRERLFFFVRSPEAMQWFMPVGSRLVSTGDVLAPGWRADGPEPIGALNYSATNEKGEAMAGYVFQIGARAPAHILIPKLQEVLHYGFVSDAKEGLSLAFLDLAGCDETQK